MLVANAEETPFLATISVERASTSTEQLHDKVHASLHVNNPAQAVMMLSGIEGIEVRGITDGAVDIIFVEQPQIPGDVETRHLGSSFVVDYDEPAVQALVEKIRASSDLKPGSDALTEFVYDYIENKTYARAFDLASRVAESATGDCTEHAVLLTALARSFDYPARIVFGTLFLDFEERSLAFGHAWSEIHDGENWIIADATLPSRDGGPRHVRYLPLSALDNEGPGYLLGMMQAMSIMPSRITGLANTE